jgi:Uma2 family endonuclease
MALTVPTRRRWTVADYHRATEAGVFGPEERLELIGGEIIVMSPQLGPHATATTITQLKLQAIFSEGWVVRIQLPLTLGEESEPEPDLAVVRGRPEDFWEDHPTTAELVVEVADTTLRFDRRDKAMQYARAGISDYWILNLPGRRLEVRRDPDPATGEYRQVSTHGADADVSPLAAPHASIRVGDVLPPVKTRGRT